jgi:ABC-type antimicrobial peptide transport system permease subunit
MVDLMLLAHSPNTSSTYKSTISKKLLGFYFSMNCSLGYIFLPLQLNLVTQMAIALKPL